VWTTTAIIVSLFVVFAIQWAEYSRLRNANGVVLFYWLFLLIAWAVKLRSLVSQQIYATDLAYFVTYNVGFGLSVVEFLVEWLWPKSQSSYEALVDDEECPAEYATVFSLLTFSWMTPLMKYGHKQYLTENDLWGLVHTDKTNYTGKSFAESWQRELTHRKKPSLWISLFRSYGGPYAAAAIFKIGNDVAQFTQPQLLRLLITWVDSYENGKGPEPVIKGAAISLAMFAIAAFQTGMIVGFALFPPARPSSWSTKADRFSAPILPADIRNWHAHQGRLDRGHLSEIPQALERRSSRKVDG